jgi:hypothetical protein
LVEVEGIYYLAIVDASAIRGNESDIHCRNFFSPIQADGPITGFMLSLPLCKIIFILLNFCWQRVDRLYAEMGILL